MAFTFLLFLHLIATCAAIGTLVVADIRLVATLVGYRVVVPRPGRFETVMVMVSLLVLYVTGFALIAMGMGERPDYLANGKLQAKLVLVGVLTSNAFLLHWRTFPILALGRTVSSWSRVQWLTVAASGSLSNTLWLFCAFLGVARPWNFQVSVWFVLGWAMVVWACVFALCNLALYLGSRDGPGQGPDWLDSLIAHGNSFTGRAVSAADRQHLNAFDPGARQPYRASRFAHRPVARSVDRRARKR